MVDHVSFLHNAVQSGLRSVTDKFSTQKTESCLPEPRIADIQKQIIMVPVNDSAKTIFRIFATGTDFPDYDNVGWIMNDEITHCLLCGQEFGFFCYKHHCRACGNLICNECSLNRAIVKAIEELGLQRVCKACFHGEDTVEAVYTRLNESEKKTLSAREALLEPIDDDADTQTDDVVSELRSTPQTDKDNKRPISSSSEQSRSEFNQASDRPNSTNRLSKSHNSRNRSSVSRVSIVRRSVPAALSRKVVEPAIHAYALKCPKDRPKEIEGFNLVTPSPCIVIKTRRIVSHVVSISNEINKHKVFVNICSHELVAPTPRGLQPYKIVSPERCSTDKEGERCSVFDVVAHPNNVQTVATDANARILLCQEALELIQSLFFITLEQEYRVLKVQHNYKSDDEGGICSIYMPPVLLFHMDAKAAAETSLQLDAASRSLSPQQLLMMPLSLLQSNRSVYATSAVPTADGNLDSSKSGSPQIPTIIGLTAASSYTAPSRKSVVIPLKKSGMLFKIGRFVKSWKRLFIAVDFGELRFYDSESADELKLKGSMFLAAFSASLSSDEKIMLNHCNQNMLLYIQNDRRPSTVFEHNEWVRVLQQHIKYADDRVRNNPRQMLHAVSPRTLLSTSSKQLKLDENSSFRVTIGFLAAVDASTINKSKLPLNMMNHFKLPNVLVAPESGFALSCKRTNGQVVSINICHAKHLGEVTAKLDEGGTPKPNASIPEPLPLLGSIGTEKITFHCQSDLVPQPTSSRSSVKAQGTPQLHQQGAITLDIVISTAAFMSCFEEETGDRRDEIAAEVIEYLTGIVPDLESSYSLVAVEGNYEYAKGGVYGGLRKSALGGAGTPLAPSKDATGDNILLVINLPTYLNCQTTYQVPVIEGEIMNLCSETKRWLRRTMRLIGRRMEVYSTDTDELKIVFNFFGSLSQVQPDIELQESGELRKMFPFRLSSGEVFDEDIQLACLNVDDRLAWMRIFDAQSRFVATMAFCGECPFRRSGHLNKQGRSMYKSWHRRYFIVELGHISYFSRCTDRGDEVGIELKGTLSLTGVNVELQKGINRIFISKTDKSENNMLLEAKDNATAELWYEDLKRHAKFATNNPVITLYKELEYV